MADTVKNFWRMIIETQCPTIVMLCDLVEDNQVCCYISYYRLEILRYLPSFNDMLCFEKFQANFQGFHYLLRSFIAYDFKEPIKPLKLYKLF